MTKEKIHRCCLCGKKYKGFGNNAEPLKVGRCCDTCNYDVIMSRVKELKKMQNYGRSNR